jgi:integrase
MGARRAVPYVHKHPKTGHLNYRRRIPASLRPFILRTPSEFVRTLAAHSINSPGAFERLKAAEHEYESMIAKARRASVTGISSPYDTLTPALIAFLSDFYFASELARDEQGRWGRPCLKVPYVPREELEQDWEVSREMLTGYAGEALADYWGAWAIGYAASMGYVLSPSDPEFGKYLEAVAAAACRLWLAVDRRNDAQMGEGTPVDTPPLPSRPEALGSGIRPSGDAQNTFEAIACSILESPRQDIGISTKQSAATALRLFREACGTPTPAKITRAVVSEWLDLMAQRPRQLPKRQGGLTLREVVQLYGERSDVPRLSPKTYNGHASALAALWNKAQKAGQIGEGRNNPFANQRVTNIAVPASQGAKGFSTRELETIFALPIFTSGERPQGGKGEASYWIPLLLLWTGARPEEVAQLMLADFREASGGWTVSFTDEGMHPLKGQRSLKTSRKRSGRRTIPVPRPLIDLGLPAYLAHLKIRGEVALFPLLRTKGARGLLFAGWGEWWSKLLRERGVLEPSSHQRQPSREFRHTWTTAARASGIPREACEYIQGHKAAGGTANEGYGDHAPLGRLIAGLQFEGVNLSMVAPWQPPAR